MLILVLKVSFMTSLLDRVQTQPYNSIDLGSGIKHGYQWIIYPITLISLLETPKISKFHEVVQSPRQTHFPSIIQGTALDGHVFVRTRPQPIPGQSLLLYTLLEG